MSKVDPMSHTIFILGDSLPQSFFPYPLTKFVLSQSWNNNYFLWFNEACFLFGYETLIILFYTKEVWNSSYSQKGLLSVLELRVSAKDNSDLFFNLTTNHKTS